MKKTNSEGNFKKLLAVYGTLRKGFGNHYYLENSNFLGTFKSKDNYYLICIGPYPILTPEFSLSQEEREKLKCKNISPTNIIYELYELSKSEWAECCLLEGYTGTRNHPENEYDTMDIETEFGKAEIFIQHKLADGDFVESGDYSLFKKIIIEN